MQWQSVETRLPGNMHLGQVPLADNTTKASFKRRYHSTSLIDCLGEPEEGGPLFLPLLFGGVLVDEKQVRCGDLRNRLRERLQVDWKSSAEPLHGLGVSKRQRGSRTD